MEWFYVRLCRYISKNYNRLINKRTKVIIFVIYAVILSVEVYIFANLVLIIYEKKKLIS